MQPLAHEFSEEIGCVNRNVFVKIFQKLRFTGTFNVPGKKKTLIENTKVIAPAKGRVEHQKLNRTATLCLWPFCWIFGVQREPLEKNETSQWKSAKRVRKYQRL